MDEAWQKYADARLVNIIHFNHCNTIIPNGKCAKCNRLSDREREAYENLMRECLAELQGWRAGEVPAYVLRNFIASKDRNGAIAARDGVLEHRAKAAGGHAAAGHEDEKGRGTVLQ